ncbi:MAG TPA: alkaline phosphatase family protein [Candidatus Sulfopaludibacter sp.]|jgi:phospholipase C|nr:alkaline phosphatase family protein [Candidatus Sulfopaludibacter sp.]
MSTPIQHVFVLMLENRSFDHMLGFSGISGTDAATGQPTSINGLTGTESNLHAGRQYPVTQPAWYTMPADPPHELTDVLEQLCGVGATYPPGGAYPPINHSGFVDSFAALNVGDPGLIMGAFSPGQLPVLNALAREFAVCDNWYASMPGPTWPNRFFVHAASSNGLDHSPTTAEIVLWESLQGFDFAAGTIFDRMNSHNVRWRLYAGDDFPMIAALKGIQLNLVHPYRDFANDVAAADYGVAYTFIEPSYNVLSDYKCSTSQHPLDDVTRGELLIAATYHAIRTSPLWDSSMLIVTWDEHGGFYDHAAPPAAVAPGDSHPGGDHNQFGFTFERYGVRVPAVIASPWIPRNLVDHRLYDHTSILATAEAAFSIPPMTKRDAAANNLLPLASLAAPRTDAPLDLGVPAVSGAPECPPLDFVTAAAPPSNTPPPVARPDEPVNEGNIAGVLHSALRSDLALSPPASRGKILSQFSAIKTRGQARQYADTVRQKLRAAQPSGPLGA